MPGPLQFTLVAAQTFVLSAIVTWLVRRLGGGLLGLVGRRVGVVRVRA